MDNREIVARYLCVMGQGRGCAAEDMVPSHVWLGLFHSPFRARTVPRWHLFLDHADTLLGQLRHPA